MDFGVLKVAVAKQFERMQKHSMFRVDIVPIEGVEQPSMKDLLWSTYLESFPEGTNKHFRERTEHDCSCCRQFIRAIGDAVAIIDGKLETIWDIKVQSEPGYQAVADALNALVRSKPIANIFLHYEKSAGTDKNFEQLTTGLKTWEHFFVNIKPAFVQPKDNIPTLLAVPRDAKQVFLRALTEIDLESVKTVADLIAQDSIYRGQEYKFQVTEFLKFKGQFDKLTTDEEREIFAWDKAIGLSGAVTKIGNSGIGVLLYDLAEGKDLEDSVKKFESSIMAPSNYKRPTALVSKQMIEKAKKTIEELGLTSALARRYATLSDITINNVLFANRAVKQALTGNPFDELVASSFSKTKTTEKIEEITIEKFLADVLPRVSSVEVLLDNKHANNFMSLIAPADPTAAKLFKWDNGFSWSYSGEFADSIKERVKAAGGSVTGDLLCRLAWEYSDDLDFHMHEPAGKGSEEIYFGHRHSAAGGQLDVDANGMDGIREHPVENIFYPNKSKMREGIYTLVVNNYNRRSNGIGFEVEIEFAGQMHTFSYDRVIPTRQNVEVAKIKYSKETGFEVSPTITSRESSRDIWGLPTQSFHNVSSIMLSPNYWDDNASIPDFAGGSAQAIGNKHYFFMLEGCTNDGTARGFFNEFLKNELAPHRKVLEMVGAKMQVQDSPAQLSGLGFSSTKRDAIVCRVKGSFTRQLKITF